MKHSKAPWTVNRTTLDHAVVGWHIAGAEHGSVIPVCRHTLETGADSNEQIANAYLIAAAPDLLEALEHIVGDSVTFLDNVAIEKAQRAIAKAKCL